MIENTFTVKLLATCVIIFLMFCSMLLVDTSASKLDKVSYGSMFTLAVLAIILQVFI